MRLLITGGSGFIGSTLVHLAIERGHEVLNLDKLTYAANPASLADLDDHPAYRFLHADIADADAVRAAFTGFQPESVIHLAAETHVDRSIDAPDVFIRSNVTGTFTLLQATREYLSSLEFKVSGFRFLHLSTDEVYGTLGEEGAFTESSPYAPRSPYAASKAASDHLVRAWGETYGLPVVIAHPCNTYGPRQFPEKLIPLAILRALRGEPIPIYGDGRNIRDWLHVDDLAEGLLTLLDRGRPGQSYNLGAGNELTNLDLARKLISILDEAVEQRGAPAPPIEASSFKFEDLIFHVPDRPGHDFRYSLDPTKAREELGWRPKRSIDDGLHHTVAWYLDNESWWRPLQGRSDTPV